MFDIATITSVQIKDMGNPGTPITLTEKQWVQARRVIGVIGWHERIPGGYPKIESIKLVRELTGLGLREAKMAVEAAWQCRGEDSCY